MQTLTETIWKHNPLNSVFDLNLVKMLLSNKTDPQVWELVKKALKKQEILKLRRGLYCLAKEYRRQPVIDEKVLVEQIYPHSYISFEAALYHYNLIPDVVQNISCGTSRRSKIFKTPLGTFTYIHLNNKPFQAGIVREKGPSGSYYPIATPLRALGDLLFVNKQINWEKDGLNWLFESLRMEEEDLFQISLDGFEFIYHSFASRRVRDYMVGFMRYLQNRPV